MTLSRTDRLMAAVSVVLIAAACGSESSDSAAPAETQVDTASAPADLEWRTVGGVSVPSSPTAGPSTGTGVTRHGYDKSPQGAVLAAINGQTALAVADDRTWPEVVNTVTAPGPGRDAFAVARAAVTVAGTVPKESAPRFVGFDVTAYEPDAATAAVSVAQTVGEDSQLYSYPVALQWVGGDWRIVLPTSEENIDAAELDDLAGYTELKAAS
ncbi:MULTISPECIES: hypothetical protein [unclassified Rhodococcus (in: high G+C Gram-positive bacteria)]|uniref:hypothetical protein n=1 Tax=unclassified Rhodococcus (in: high G+C Gram-positive bacteria) TaxID=192944 RepID=UPI0006F473F0|nr:MULTISPECIES: hypothetical protein [unclassified Rhodococcus (in: high G+C Gram-positive bacteria)]KQU28428.1 hypothetical protein ASG69_10465 [Rhodococcus sp. Leaf225]KQU46534.1 hypothetical protein ASH03_07495 [Rhodococcus sp. Leaf258]